MYLIIFNFIYSYLKFNIFGEGKISLKIKTQ